jgi:hypothetical protein
MHCQVRSAMWACSYCVAAPDTSQLNRTTRVYTELPHPPPLRLRLGIRVSSFLKCAGVLQGDHTLIRCTT